MAEIPMRETQGVSVKFGSAVIGELQSIGDIEETRSVKEYSSMSSNNTTKSLGSIKRGPLTIGVLFDPDDAAGQQALEDAFDNNTSDTMTIELPDVPDAGSHGTQFSFTAKVSKRLRQFPKDEAVFLEFTVEVSSEVTETPAV
ncbi:hypothetical protein [Sulfurovum mangrovi]|uniref:hypothetical protein n=1 Tax=Sulfurovum mangrovi TaxID=2893889 RepID=UPI001E3712EE|nr:hypothetical protein [Sulfurovum mangrovi]UFH59836.1 hypothetical protein LN246_03085 [Sulfurovum mangrovi]UFH59887.1 hypothetical protein LN246_03345 [Sulfurovum mangrovi]